VPAKTGPDLRFQRLDLGVEVPMTATVAGTVAT
jgi:hypothetical protein